MENKYYINNLIYGLCNLSRVKLKQCFGEESVTVLKIKQISNPLAWSLEV
jgi:hypothetical protein